jgi:hypothetical protein
MFTPSNTLSNDIKSEPVPQVVSTAVPTIQTNNFYASSGEGVSQGDLDKLLEKEKQHNKTETWNKLDKTVKMQKLHAFAEKYGREHSMPAKEIKNLKVFFVECLEKNKLQKTKDVVYNKELRELTSIPALHFNTVSNHYTLRIVDAKRVSTLKSLTPKRTIQIEEKSQSQESEM